jgi:UDP-N-acetylmuramyl pentapeptide phosphotransferase/UDP-N-acetylglucosamine-1-phosphate transferase
MNTHTLFWQMVVFLAVPAMLMSFLLCRLMRSLSPKLGYVDRPHGRKDHSRIMPCVLGQ